MQNRKKLFAVLIAFAAVFAMAISGCGPHIVPPVEVGDSSVKTNSDTTEEAESPSTITKSADPATQTPTSAQQTTSTTTPKPTGTPSVTPTATPKPIATPTATPQPSPTLSPTPKPTVTPTPTPTPKPTVTPTLSPTPKPTVTPAPTPTPKPTVTPTLSPTPKPTVTPTPTPTPKPTVTPTPTPTPEPTVTPTPTSTPSLLWNNPYTPGSIKWFAEEVYQLTNSEREKHGLTKLNRPNASLEAAAYVRAKEISVLWGHIRPNGTEFHTAMTEAKYTTWHSAGENIAKVWPYSPDRDFESIPKMMVDGLMDSEGHKDNILNP
ncbi:MAG: CAP domain-containing protein, partial [Clostridiaceae bacterium]|nr:CAP domain-containing protein [Clostridiaceae bacterium]